MVSLATWRRDLDLDALEDKEKLPRGLLTSVMRHESAGDPQATSRVGAGGLFQLMPPTARQYGADPYDPPQAARAAAKELGSHYRRYGGDLQQTLAAWNWGSGNLQRKGIEGMPAETRQFIRNVSSGVGEQYAAAGELTFTDTGRGKGTGAPKKAPAWTDVIPDELPGAPAPTAPLPGGGPAPKAPAWTDTIPDELPGVPTASPAPPEAQAAPQPPPGAAGAPGAFQPPQRVTPPEQWGMQQAPAQVQAMGEASLQDIQPLDPSGVSRAVNATEAPPGFSVLGLDGRPHPQTAQIAQTLAQQGTPLSGTYHVRGDATPEQLMANPASALSPAPTAANTARAARDTAQDVGAGVAGAVAGAAVGGVPGMIAGPVIAQGALDRARMQLGLRPQEKAVFETGVVDIYQADLLNAGFGLLLGIPDLARAAITKSSAGKAILAADDAAKKAAKEFTDAEAERQAAFATKQTFNRETFDRKIANARKNYDDKVQKRDALIAEHQAEFDQATIEYQQQKAQRDAQAQDVDAANWTNQQRYQREVERQQQTADLTAQGRYQEARQAMTPERQAEVDKAFQKAYEAEARPMVRAEEAYQSKAGQVQRDTSAHKEAVERVQALPEVYKEGGDTASVKYGRIMDEAKDEWVSHDTARAEVKAFREEDYKHLLDDSTKPMPPEVEFYAKQLEGMDPEKPASVRGTWESMKELGKLTASKNGDVRRTASALYGIYSDMLEQAPGISAAIKDANRTFKREKAVEEIASWSQKGTGSFVKRDAQNRLVLNQTALFNRLDTLERNKLFRGAFSDEEWKQLRQDVGEFAGTPGMPAPVERPALPPHLPGAMEAPTVKPEAPPELSKVIQQPPEVTPPTLKQEKPLAPFPTTTFEETTAGRRTFEPGKPPPTQEEARMAAELGPSPRLAETAGSMGRIGGVAYLLQRAGLTPGGVDKLIWGTLIGIGAKTLTKQAEYHILSKALMNQDGRRLLKAAVDSKGVIDPSFYGAYLSTLTMPERKAFQRDLPKEPEEKGGRRGASR